MNEDKKMKEWIDNKIKELKKVGDYYFERGTAHLTLRDIEKECSDEIVDSYKPIKFQRVDCVGNKEEIFFSYEMWIDNEQIIITLDESNGHYGKKIEEGEKDRDDRLRRKLEEDYEEMLEIEQYERENGIK
tara:strand:- start:430 stop:822 length:393 start_codon:yes stop_codon:yes gene_type:complete